MNDELINTIKSLYEQMEEHEKKYQLAVDENEDYNALKSVRTQMGFIQEEITRLELSLFDEFRDKL